MSKLFKQDQAKQCEAWSHLGAVNRCIILKEAARKLAKISPDAAKANHLFNHLLSQAEKLDEVTNMSGATGESNELYWDSRGKTMVLATDDSSPIAFLGQLIAALLAGNEVFLRFPSQQQLCEQAVEILSQSGVYSGVMSITNDSELTTLLHINGLAIVAAVGPQKELAKIGQQLAETDGILTQLVPVSDLQGCAEMFQPEYIERFCTERVKTVNTTAIGGNASLLELGVG